MYNRIRGNIIIKGACRMEISTIKAKADEYKELVDKFNSNLEKLEEVIPKYIEMWEAEGYKRAQEFKRQFVTAFKMNRFEVENFETKAKAKYKYKVIDLSINNKKGSTIIYNLLESGQPLQLEFEITLDKENPHKPHWEIEINGKTISLLEEGYKDVISSTCFTGQKFDVDAVKSANEQIEEHINFMQFRMDNFDCVQYMIYGFEDRRIKGKTFEEILKQL